MKTLEIDLECYSSVDLGKSGVYRYAEAPDFEILLFGYSVDGGEVNVVDLAQGERIPAEILDALPDDSVIKTSYNANFERVCLSRYLRDMRVSLDPFHDRHTLSAECAQFLNPSSWRCSMVWSAYLGLPQSLKGVGQVLNLEEQKMDEGKALIKYFCVPCTPTKANGGQTRNLPSDAPDKWEIFKAYNRRDVEVEMAIQKRLARFPVPDSVWEEYCIDQEINDRGVRIDMDLVEKAIEMDASSRAELTALAKEITNLENPNSVVQMKQWLCENGLEVESLGKKEVAAVMETAPEKLREVLELRQQLAKSSVKKYQAMENAVCDDGRARGMYRFYGGSKTGRYASVLIQTQNLRQNHLPDLAEARALVKTGDYEAVKMLYEDVPDTLSQLVRTAFVPSPGMLFYVADFSAIEARVIAWLAGEQWVLDAFAKGEDIYCATASRMFHCNVVKNGENGELRQKGKQATLSCSYGGSVGALKAMGALESGMKEEELKPLVTAWREANPHIVQLWWDLENAALKAVRDRTCQETHGLQFSLQSGILFVRLPSGRSLAYVKPKIGMNRFGGDSITYEGIGATKKWERIEMFPGKWAENCTQAIARDVLCCAMKTLRNCRIVMHIHDELVIEAPPDMSLEAVCEQMGRTPPWAPGLVLRADGYVTPFYKKD